MSYLSVGDEVLIRGELGIVRFAGSTDFESGIWLGVELLNGKGKNDGSVKGKRYFSCEKGKGIFVRACSSNVMKRPSVVKSRKKGSENISNFMEKTKAIKQKSRREPSKFERSLARPLCITPIDSSTPTKTATFYTSSTTENLDELNFSTEELSSFDTTLLNSDTSKLSGLDDSSFMEEEFVWQVDNVLQECEKKFTPHSKGSYLKENLKSELRKGRLDELMCENTALKEKIDKLNKELEKVEPQLTFLRSKNSIEKPRNFRREKFLKKFLAMQKEIKYLRKRKLQIRKIPNYKYSDRSLNSKTPKSQDNWTTQVTPSSLLGVSEVSKVLQLKQVQVDITELVKIPKNPFSEKLTISNVNRYLNIVPGSLDLQFSLTNENFVHWNSTVYQELLNLKSNNSSVDGVKTRRQLLEENALLSHKVLKLTEEIQDLETLNQLNTEIEARQSEKLNEVQEETQRLSQLLISSQPALTEVKHLKLCLSDSQEELLQLNAKLEKANIVIDELNSAKLKLSKQVEEESSMKDDLTEMNQRLKEQIESYENEVNSEITSRTLKEFETLKTQYEKNLCNLREQLKTARMKLADKYPQGDNTSENIDWLKHSLRDSNTENSIPSPLTFACKEIRKLVADIKPVSVEKQLALNWKKDIERPSFHHNQQLFNYCQLTDILSKKC
ncbi:Microtubule-associated protein ssm4 [Schizosaccharomyces pombe]|uniref:Microtubule-associated protein ssm4 n=1 Tax=Schizosaccharomyces pombe (strain 972 / ATCC 24843) TaxID=284812 RepID=SSM4_SCHPO|nr:p150-Glued [Schizosaccharomyces pombe]O42667.1 RecName: Full=Microtubule-associated protein ssm4 [Schizosaccharomyces pombe 972h-]BAA31857.1 ssm4 [Schizosaccharomyces pombe]CAA15832.1 p150-Glued [Schizosaccharomyces pombe]|eukprot:NP_594619.1 p150-Glued [Schizosaccharomyces pombe]